MQSLSSQMVSNITYFRNPNGTEHEWTRNNQRASANPLKIAIAEAGYLAVIPFSVVELGISLIATTFAKCLPISQERYTSINEWMHSSAFATGWAACDALINIFCNDMIVTEKVARACAESGDYFSVPQSAL